ncbi:hypothetical protein [Holzapfeliella sp. JNUCC 80]
MTILHTLGPKTTDSYKAASYFISQNTDCYPIDQIVLHSSFDEIYQQLDALNGDLFLVPVAYQNNQHHQSFADYHYRYWQSLTVLTSFHIPTMPMVLLENLANQNHKISLHPATSELMKSTFSNLDSLKINYVTSKPLAFDDFAKGNCQYAIVSHNFTNQELSGLNYRIAKTFTPQMIWCLYKIE